MSEEEKSEEEVVLDESLVAAELDKLIPLQARLQADFEKAQAVFQEVQAAYKQSKAQLTTFNERYGLIVQSLKKKEEEEEEE